MQMLHSLAHKTPLDIAIVGGGATGVELAAELLQAARDAEVYGGTGMSQLMKITLIESGARLLAAFTERISAEVRHKLEGLGVTVLTDTRVTSALSDGLTLNDGRFVHASLPVWAAGVKAPYFLEKIDGLETTPGHQLIITPTLQTTRDAAIYALGDCSSLTPPGRDHPLPPTAQVAHQQAQYLIRHLLRGIAEGAPSPFVYRDLGSLVTLGEYGAYGSLGKFGIFDKTYIKGRLAQLSHIMLYRAHQARLHGFWRGGLLWLVDRLNAKLRPAIRLD